MRLSLAMAPRLGWIGMRSTLRPGMMKYTVVPANRGWYQVRQYSPYRLSALYRLGDAIALADWLDERWQGYVPRGTSVNQRTD